MQTKMNCYDSEIWRLSSFDSQQKYGKKYYFVLVGSIDKQLFYEHEFKINEPYIRSTLMNNAFLSSFKEKR